jgi:glycosyltransferase involved in cell wall biosynthesis
MTRVVFTVPWGRRLGGAENMLWTYLSHADRERLDATVVFFEAGRFEREVAQLGMQTAVIPTGRLRDARAAVAAIRALARLLRSSQPDLVVNWMAKAHVYGSPAALLARGGIPLVWWQHSLPSGHWLDRIASLLPASAVGCSSDTAARAQRSMCPHRRAFVVHPGVAPAQQMDRQEHIRLREELCIPPDRTVVGMLGRLQPGKAQDRFVQALDDLRHRGANVHGLIVGGDAHDLSPDYSARLRELVHELGLDDVLTMAGQVSDPTRYLQAMDVLVSAGEAESFGIALVEAMAHGVPVVAVAAGGSLEIVEPERSGVLVPSSEPQMLADAIARLVHDEGLRRKLGEHGRSRATESFSATRMTESLQRNLEAVARGTA